MVMIIMMISLKGAIRDFYSILTSPRTVSNVVCHVVRRDSSAVEFDRVEIEFILA